MKNLAMITLIGLIGLACFIPTHLNSHVLIDPDGDGMLEYAHTDGQGVQGFGGKHQLLTFVYGRVIAWTHYEYPKAHTAHSAYISNYSGGLPNWPNQIHDLRFYVDFHSRIEGPHGYEDDGEWHHEGWLDSYWSQDPDALPGYWWVDYKHLKEYDLVTEEVGDYTLTAESKLTAKKDINGDGIREVDVWEVEDELDIQLDHEPLGIDDWNWDGE